MCKEYNKLVIDRIPRRFNEGLFWGNGCIGGLLYVTGNSLRFSLDHVQLWETRDTSRDTPGGTFQDFISDPDLFHNGTYFQQPLEADQRIWRTHLPGLSLIITFEDEIVDFSGNLDFHTASSEITLTLQNGRLVSCSVYIDSNVNVLKVRLDTENTAITIRGWDLADENMSLLTEWDYAASTVETDGDVVHVLQPYSGEGLAAFSLLKRSKDIYITLEALLAAGNTPDSRAAMLDRNKEVLMGYSGSEAEYRQAHDASWDGFWNRFQVRIPNLRLQHAFQIEMYKIYSNQRRGSYPVTLQGIWNNDARMPAWYGDWHNDMNVQACYWPVYKTNNIELAQAYIDYYISAVPRLTERAYKLFGIKDAIHCPVMMGPEGYGAGGEWCFWNTLLGPELFVALDFIWYYDFSRDRKRLENCVYPFVEKVIHLYQGLAFSGEDGYYHIPFTNSPEVFKNGAMLIKDDSTVVIATLHYILNKMCHFAKLLGRQDMEFEEFDKKLIPVTTTDKGYPLFPGEDLFESHRHFCQMFPVFPLGSDTHSEAAARSLDTVVDQGFTEYAAWSFPYLAIFAARCGRGNMARTALEIYCMAFRSRNTFVVNGDPNSNGILRISDTNAGESSDTFTVEAGFIAAAAISEMFVHRSNDTVYVAFGIPDEWKDCSCTNLTIEGGHRISVQMEDYEIRKVEIYANCNETLAFSFDKCSRPLLQSDQAWARLMTAEKHTYTVSLEDGGYYCFE